MRGKNRRLSWVLTAGMGGANSVADSRRSQDASQGRSQGRQREGGGGPGPGARLAFTEFSAYDPDRWSSGNTRLPSPGKKQAYQDQVPGTATQSIIIKEIHFISLALSQ